MKKLIFVLEVIAVVTAFAKEEKIFGPVIPKNTARLLVNEAVEKAKAYTDEAIGGVSGSTESFSNALEAVQADVVELNTRCESFISEEADPSVPEWAKDENKPTYDASEITYGNGYVGSYLTEFAETVYTKTAADEKFLAKEDAAVLTEAVGEATAAVATIEALTAKVKNLASRLAVVEYTYTPISSAVAVVSEPGVEMPAYTQPEKDVVVGGTIDTGNVIVTSKSFVAKEATIAPEYTLNGNGVEVAAGRIDLDESDLTGATQQSSNLFNAKECHTLVIKGTTFSGDTYNTIMTGQMGQPGSAHTYLDEMTIEDCTFDENCKHVNVWFAGFQDEAVLTIKNCTFKTCEQFLCVSDFAGFNNKLTINLENVRIQNYERAEGDKYSGIMLFDDRLASSEAQFLENKPFSNITLNITNCYAGDTKLTAANFKMGTNDADQMAYVYCYASKKTYNYADYKAQFPTVVIDGVTVE